MQQTITHPPRTIMEVFKMLPEGTLAEVIENALFMSPTPSSNHQRISRQLSTQLDNYVTKNNLGEIFYAPLDVYLDETSNAVQPDIFFISKENSSVTISGVINGAPDLIIEITSPGNKKHDTITKKNLYEKFRVKEYWVVDSETKQTTGYLLKENQFTLIGEDIGKITSVLLEETFTF